MVKKVYVEGGGNGRALRAACREHFSTFIEKSGLAKADFSIVACGNRNDAYDRFKRGHAGGDATAMLLVDAERPVTAQGPWQHLQGTPDGWVRPDCATDDQCHLMVQIMESWFLADAEALESHYRQGFRRQALPPNLNIEMVSKQDVLDGLRRAARNTSKGGYNKARDGFKILQNIDPKKVRNRSQYADRFLKALGA